MCENDISRVVQGMIHGAIRAASSRHSGESDMKKGVLEGWNFEHGKSQFGVVPASWGDYVTLVYYY